MQAVQPLKSFLNGSELYAGGQERMLILRNFLSMVSCSITDLHIKCRFMVPMFGSRLLRTETFSIFQL